MTIFLFVLPDKIHILPVLQRTTSWNQVYRPLNKLENKLHLLEERHNINKQMLVISYSMYTQRIIQVYTHYVAPQVLYLCVCIIHVCTLKIWTFLKSPLKIRTE